MPRCSGVTLWEMLVVLAVLAILAGLSAPSVESVMLDSQRTAHVNAFVTAIQLARSEAAKRSRPVVVCKSADRLTCAGSELHYDAGWMVFVNEDDERPPHRSVTEPLLHAYRPEPGTSIRSNRPRFEFRPFRRRSTNGTVIFCDRRGATAARAVVVSYTGRPRASDSAPGGQPLTCPP